jgi:hypothetical protein
MAGLWSKVLIMRETRIIVTNDTQLLTGSVVLPIPMELIHGFGAPNPLQSLRRRGSGR